jgi:hypothetical protein
MRRIYLGLSLTLAFLLVACALGVDRPYDSTELPTRDHGLVYVVSPNTPCINVGTWTIFLDDRAVVRLGENTYTKLTLPVGHYKFSTSTDKKLLCHDGRPSNWPPVYVDVQKGGTTFVVYGSSSQIHGSSAQIPFYCIGTCERYLQSVDKETAEKLIAGTKYVAPQTVMDKRP